MRKLSRRDEPPFEADRQAGVDKAEFGMTRVRIGLFQHAMAHPEGNSERSFESIEAKLDELRSYLYANRESVRGYAEAYLCTAQTLSDPPRGSIHL